MLQIWKLHSTLCCLQPVWPRSVSKSTSKFASQHQQTATQQPWTGVFFWTHGMRLPHHRSQLIKQPLAVKGETHLTSYLCVSSFPPTQSFLMSSTDPPGKKLHNRALAVQAGWTVCIRKSYTCCNLLYIYTYLYVRVYIYTYIFFKVKYQLNCLRGAYITSCCTFPNWT